MVEAWKDTTQTIPSFIHALACLLAGLIGMALLGRDSNRGWTVSMGCQVLQRNSALTQVIKLSLKNYTTTTSTGPRRCLPPTRGLNFIPLILGFWAAFAFNLFQLRSPGFAASEAFMRAFLGIRPQPSLRPGQGVTHRIFLIPAGLILSFPEGIPKQSNPLPQPLCWPT